MSVKSILGGGILTSLASKLLGSPLGATLGLGILGPQALHKASEDLQNPLQTGVLGPVLQPFIPDPLAMNKKKKQNDGFTNLSPYGENNG